ncbi:hypothetical protein [Psychrobacillus sp. L3]|uniref:hypothetical protein n=1 Tax=Psychrobacillus sp. L3 TaxID=3236891 RepID=UPI0036F2FCB3
MKKELNLQSNLHVELIQKLALKSLNGIKVSEVLELRQTYKQDKNIYFNLLKLKYIIHLEFLSIEYKITKEVEKAVFGYVNYLILELPMNDLLEDAEITISIN